MNFREYRRRDTIRAAEITEEKMLLKPESGTDSPGGDVPIEFGKGDYVELRDGTLLGWAKIEFETAFISTRAPRTIKANKKERKRGAAQTSGVIV